MTAWSTIESDPGVFTTMMRDLGVQGLQMTDLWTLDDDLLASIEPVYSLVFLFKHLPSSSAIARAAGESHDAVPFQGWFAKQIAENACGTMAVINSVMNIKDGDGAGAFHLGQRLTDLKQFTEGALLDADMTGSAIASDDALRSIHNRFARPELFEFDESLRNDEKEDAFHFVVFQPIDGHIWELDGLQQKPICHGLFDASRPWWSSACSVIQQRIASYGETEVRSRAISVYRAD